MSLAHSTVLIQHLQTSNYVTRFQVTQDVLTPIFQYRLTILCNALPIIDLTLSFDTIKQMLENY